MTKPISSSSSSQRLDAFAASTRQVEAERPIGGSDTNSDKNIAQSSPERLRPQDLPNQQRPALANKLLEEFQKQLPTSPQASVEPALQPERTMGKASSSKAPDGTDVQGRLVVVSNRVVDQNKPAAGGLAVALGEVMRKNDLWFGWSNETSDVPGPKIIRTEPFECRGLPRDECPTLAKIDLSQEHHDNYYAGFSNSVLWPIFHEKVKLADLNPAYFEAYEQVNKMFASELKPMLKENDVLWIHDYHLIPLAQKLRALGCKQRIGFFNHIPLPSPEVIKQIPQHKQLMESLFSYDLIGMQSAKDVENLGKYVEMEGDGQRLAGARMDAFGRKSTVQNFPIGINVESFQALEPSAKSQAVLDKVRAESGQRMLMIGVDRLDYSKGVPKRLKAFREMLETHSEMLNRVTLVQIAAPTRKGVPAYDRLSEKTQKLADEINDQFRSGTWEPVMYINKSVDRNALPALYRLSRVGVVTPVADGMNLVAKEYIAAQAPENPGVLVLSTKAGAASQLRESLLVEPKDRGAIAKAYESALTMPLEERKERHAALLNNVKTENLSRWRENYLTTLSSVPLSSAPDDQGTVAEVASVTSAKRKTDGGGSS